MNNWPKKSKIELYTGKLFSYKIEFLRYNVKFWKTMNN